MKELKIKPQEKYIVIPFVGYIPFWSHPRKPSDQLNPTLEDCPTCHKKMWVSDRKRDYQKKTGWQIICFVCLMDEIRKMGIDPREVEFLDIGKLN